MNRTDKCYISKLTHGCSILRLWIIFFDYNFYNDSNCKFLSNSLGYIGLIQKYVHSRFTGCQIVSRICFIYITVLHYISTNCLLYISCISKFIWIFLGPATTECNKLSLYNLYSMITSHYWVTINSYFGNQGPQSNHKDLSKVDMGRQ